MQPLTIRFAAGLRAHRGRLHPGDGPGKPVHAGSFLRKREIVLDIHLLSSPGELARILTHEIFHFSWIRLGNAARSSYECLLIGEIALGARGELGWSAEERKMALMPRDRKARTRRWREYVCESFCDTAAWLFGGARRHSEFTLAQKYRARRRAWFRSAEVLKKISV